MKSWLYILTTLLIAFTACNTVKQSSDLKNKQMKEYAIRLKPGEDLRQSLEKFAVDNKIDAGWIVSCAGSLTHYNIRFANQPNGASGEGHFEIVSLTGTLSRNGSHIHTSISDSTGKTIGGHLLEGCTIYTTAEIIIQSSDNLIFTREKDGTTPWDELQIKVKQ